MSCTICLLGLAAGGTLNRSGRRCAIWVAQSHLCPKHGICPRMQQQGSMLQPGVRTLARGFEAHGWQVLRGWGVAQAARGLYKDTLDATEAGGFANWSTIEPPLGAGDIFVWVGVLGAIAAAAHLRGMRARGVFTAYYSSDSGVTSCNLKQRLGDAVAEVWEYNHANQLLCNLSRPVRYLPPGYMPEMRLANISDQTPTLIFAGNLHNNPARRKIFADLDREVQRLGLHARLVSRDDLWDDAAWNRVFMTNAFFANLHKSGDDYRNLFKMNCEAFRFATLLSAGAHVISLRCHPLDEAEYDDGLVLFVNNASDIVAAFGSAIDRARRSEGTLPNRRDAFASRFNVEALFWRAGIPALMSRLQSEAEYGKELKVP